MNLKTAASRLSVHYQTAYKLVRSGALTAVKIGGTYEVSEAALERYKAEREALRGLAAAEPRSFAPLADVERSRETVLADVRAVALATTTTAQGTFDTIVREAALAVGDTCSVRLGEASKYRPVAWYTTDPCRRAALSAMISGFNSEDPDSPIAEIKATHRAVLVPHVPQDRMRASLHPEARQYLDQIGLHSFIGAPAIVDGRLEAVVTMSRATPGAPYGKEDLEFVEAIADLLALALVRERVYQAGWDRRRELVAALRHSTNGARTPQLDGVLHQGGVAEIVDQLDGTVVANDVALRITNGDPSSLVRGTVLTGSPAHDRFAQGDLEYHDDERDLVLADGETRRFVIHRGFVRDQAAEPIALVVVAQAAPVAA